MDVTYLDHNACSPVSKTLSDQLARLVFETSANPSSSHAAGRLARKFILETQDSLANALRCDARGVFFVSGASEANSWVIHDHFTRCQTQSLKPVFISSEIEHESILAALESVKHFGAEVRFIPTLETGEIDVDRGIGVLNDVLHDFASQQILVLAQHTNNETGVIHNIAKLGAKCREHNLALHVDMVQSLGKIAVSFEELGCTTSAISGHKIGALKGVGALIARPLTKNSQKGFWIQNAMISGKQQRGYRGGTENALAIASLGIVLETMLQTQTKTLFSERHEKLRNDFEQRLLNAMPRCHIFGKNAASRLCNTTYVGFSSGASETLLMKLDQNGILVSAGAACASGSILPSHVLLAMGVDTQTAKSAIRISSGPNTSLKDYEALLNVLPSLIG